MSDITNYLGLGKDPDSTAQPIGISGEENDEIKILTINKIELFGKILKEYKKFNMQLETITGVNLTQKDVESYRKTL